MSDDPVLDARKALGGFEPAQAQKAVALRLLVTDLLKMMAAMNREYSDEVVPRQRLVGRAMAPLLPPGKRFGLVVIVDGQTHALLEHPPLDTGWTPPPRPPVSPEAAARLAAAEHRAQARADRERQQAASLPRVAKTGPAPIGNL